MAISGGSRLLVIGDNREIRKDHYETTILAEANKRLQEILSEEWIATEDWKVYPMPRQRFFTRDIEISEDDGAIYTTNSHFPTWQSEGGVPTLLRITPLNP